MVPKRKSTSTQNPLRDFGSFGSFDPLPHFSIWFCGEKAHKDFLENFQQRDVHLECQVILLDLFDTSLLGVIQIQGWESLCKIPERCPVMYIQEFYSNIQGIDTSMPRFAMMFQGTCIVVTLDLISEVLHVPRVVHPDYPGYEHLKTVSKDELLSHFCERPSI